MLAVLDRLGGSFRRSLENPSYSLNDPEAYDYLVGPKSDSGVVVTRRAALGLAPFWRGVNLIANGCAGVGLHLHKRKNDDDSERDVAHPVYTLVKDRPNEVMSAFEFWRTLYGHAVSDGNGYAYIERERGVPVALLPLAPQSVTVVRRDGQLWYIVDIEIDENRTETRRLYPEEVIHVKGLGFDGLVGYSVLSILQDTIGGAIGTRKHATAFYKNGTALSGVLEIAGSGAVPDKLIKQLKAEWKSLHTGLDNQHKTAILGGGTQFKPISIDAQKAQLLESRKFSIVEIAAILGLPPHKLGDSERTSYNSLEMEERAVAKDAFDPWWIQVEDECKLKLLTKREQESRSHFFKWNRAKSIQTDTKGLAEALGAEVSGGLMTIDEARSKMEMPPLPEGRGQVLFYPSGANLTPINIMTGEKVFDDPEPQPAPSTGNDQPEDTPDGNEDDNRMSKAAPFARKLAEDALSRMCTRIGEKAKRASAKPDTFIEFVEDIHDRHCIAFDDMWGPVSGMARALGGSGMARDEFFAAAYNRLTEAAECQPDALAERVAQAIGLLRNDASRIAEAAVIGDKHG